MNNFKIVYTLAGFNDNNEIFHETFAELDNVYEMEKSLTFKQTNRLSWKALHAHSIKRHNFKLTPRILNETNMAVLKCLCPDYENLSNWNGTSRFIDVLLKLWNMLNVKSVSKRWNK